MYQPPYHREDRLEIQHALIRAHPLGLLVTVNAGRLEANLLPFTLDPTTGAKGVLKAHLARANGQWQGFDPGVEALVVFQGAERYITPSWYATKAETGKVVPTWNYAVVQVGGPLRIVDDAAWLREQIGELTRAQEEAAPRPWVVADAPADYVEAQMRAIVGIEIPIERIEGKWKVSQNRPERDRAGVVAGLESAGDAEALAMAALVAGGEAARRTGPGR